jgi:hypothetical protein
LIADNRSWSRDGPSSPSQPLQRSEAHRTRAPSSWKGLLA